MKTSRLFRLLPLLGAGLAVAALVCFDGSSTPQAHAGSVEQGKNLYRLYCSRCHGHNGRGGGPVGRLMDCEPVDLTQLSGDGVFPQERVAEALDHTDVACAGRMDFVHTLDDSDRKALVNFLRKIQQR